MTWEFFKALLPSMLMHFAFTSLIFSAVYFVLKRHMPTFNFKLSFVFVCATALSAWHSMNTMMQLSQNQSLAKKQQELAQKAEQDQIAALPGNNPNLQPGTPEELKVRQQFVNVFEQFVNAPQNLNEKNRSLFFASFTGVYKNPQLVELYRNNISNYYVCHRSYYADTIATLETQKPVQSENTKACASLTGEFLNAKTLIPDAIKAIYNKAVTIVNAKRYTASKELPTIPELKQTLQRNEVALQVVAALFPQAQQAATQQ